MTDLAFDNYCINCEKLCSTASIYCSDTCKMVDESNTKTLNSQFYNGGINADNSPLLSPNFANYNYNYNYTYTEEPQTNYYIPVDSIDEISLNSTNSNYNNNIISTSTNYKKWLTGACL